MRVGRGLLAAGLLLACEARAPAREPKPEPPPAPARVEVREQSSDAPQQACRAERHFGRPAELPGDPIPVAALLAAPEPYLGQRIKCEGKVARVCQNAGCWLELQAEQGGGLRVPMAGHAFFIPQDAV